MEYMYLRTNQKKSMKKSIYHILLSCILIGICGACSKDNKLSGTALIGKLGDINDTLYLYGTDRFYDQLDTIYVHKGEFIHQLDIDTTIIAFLYSKTFQERPLFLTPNNQITILRDTTDSTRLITADSPINRDYEQLRNTLAELPDSLKNQTLEDYITAHPFSMSSIGAIQAYLAWTPEPDYKQIEELIDKLPGILKDRQDVEEIQTLLTRAQRAQVGRSALFFNVPSFDGKKFDKKDFNNKTYLLYFWASWDQQSNQLNQELKSLYKTWKKQKDFEILGINLDRDTLALQEVLKRDTISWKIAYDLDGLESKVADRYGLMKLPTTYLINKHGTIEARDIPVDSIHSFLEKTFNTKKKIK